MAHALKSDDSVKTITPTNENYPYTEFFYHGTSLVPSETGTSPPGSESPSSRMKKKSYNKPSIEPKTDFSYLESPTAKTIKRLMDRRARSSPIV